MKLTRYILNTKIKLKKKNNYEDLNDDVLSDKKINMFKKYFLIPFKNHIEYTFSINLSKSMGKDLNSNKVKKFFESNFLNSNLIRLMNMISKNNLNIEINNYVLFLYLIPGFIDFENATKENLDCLKTILSDNLKLIYDKEKSGIDDIIVKHFKKLENKHIINENKKEPSNSENHNQNSETSFTNHVSVMKEKLNKTQNSTEIKVDEKKHEFLGKKRLRSCNSLTNSENIMPIKENINENDKNETNNGNFHENNIELEEIEEGILDNFPLKGFEEFERNDDYQNREESLLSN
jgi:hypothetical protein